MSAIKKLQAKLKVQHEHQRKIMAPGYVSRSGYIRGDQIYNITEFARRLQQRLPFYFNHKFMVAGFIEHWSFYQVQAAINNGRLVCAVKVERN